MDESKKLTSVTVVDYLDHEVIITVRWLPGATSDALMTSLAMAHAEASVKLAKELGIAIENVPGSNIEGANDA